MVVVVVVFVDVDAELDDAALECEYELPPVAVDVLPDAVEAPEPEPEPALE